MESNKKSICDILKKIIFVFISSVLYFMAIAIGIVPFTLIVNDTVSGDILVPNAASILVSSSVLVIGAMTRFVTSIYNSALSDYVGRKPMILASITSLVLGRVIMLGAKGSNGFYLSAFISGIFDCYMGVSIAWICDIVDETNRGIGLGLLGGSIGIAFTLGVPLGAYVATEYSPYYAIHISISLLVVSGIYIIFIPTDDTLGTRSNPREQKQDIDIGNQTNTQYSISNRIRQSFRKHIKFQKRSFPTNILLFIKDYSPLRGLTIIVEANTPHDWITNLLFQVSLQILQTNLLQFGFLVFHWTSEDAGIVFACIGIGVSLSSAAMLHLYTENQVVVYGGILSFLGFTVFAIAGTGLSQSGMLAFPGVLLISLGGSWSSALQSILTKQYPKDRQGEATGVLGQQGVLAIVPAYLGGISFSLFIRADAPFYWPGSAFGLVST